MIERKVVDITDQGAFVDAGVFGDLFVPHKQLPKDLKIGDMKLFPTKTASVLQALVL